VKLNLAIILTLFRIAAIPAVVVCFYSTMPHARPIAAILFGVAAVTDFLDGWVARRFKQTSRFGEFLDPVADKLMVAIVLVMLVQSDPHWHVDIIRNSDIRAARVDGYDWRAREREGDMGGEGQDGPADVRYRFHGLPEFIHGSGYIRDRICPAGCRRRHDHLVDDDVFNSSMAFHRR
jgi:hypothetical protein